MLACWDLMLIPEFWRAAINELPTDNLGRQAAQEIYSKTLVGDSMGMGLRRKRGRDFPTIWDSVLGPVPLAKEAGRGGSDVSNTTLYKH